MQPLTACLCLVAVVAALFAGAPAAALAADDVTPLLEKLPGPLNTLAIVRLTDLLKSPRAKQEGWADKYEHGYADGAVAIPPVVDVLVYGGDLHPGSDRATERRGIVRLNWKEPPTLGEMAKRQKGRTEFVAKTPVVFSPRYGFAWPIEPNVLAIVPTADRQQLARWIRAMGEERRVPLSSYLRGTVARMPHAQIVIAVDAADLTNQEAMRHWIGQSVAMQGHEALAEKAADALDGLVGLQIGAEVLLKTRGLVRFDFSEPIDEETAQAIQKLFIEWLGMWGAAIEELEYCSVRAEGKAVLLEMPLADDGLRRVMTLIQVPAPQMAPAPSPSTTAKPTAEELALAASLKYYNAVQTLLHDLQKLNRKASNYYRTAVWHENYARRIDQLPAEHVDSELLDWGASVANNLRALASSLRGVPYNVNLLDAQKYSNDYFIPGVTVQYGTYGYVPGTYYSDNNFGEIRAKQAEAVAAGDSDRDQIWNAIDSETAAVVQKMYERFKVDFNNPQPKQGK